MQPGKYFSDKTLRDIQLIDSACNRKDERAYTRLMQNYRKALYYTLLKRVGDPDDAEDLLMETFTKAFRMLPRFKKEHAFSTWLYRIALNHCTDFQRKRRLETINLGFSVMAGEKMEFDFRDSNPNPHEQLMKSQKGQLLQHLIAKLPVSYQQVVHLRYFRGLTYPEIAREVNTPLGTFKAKLHYSHRMLHDLIKLQPSIDCHDGKRSKEPVKNELG